MFFKVAELAQKLKLAGKTTGDWKRGAVLLET